MKDLLQSIKTTYQTVIANADSINKRIEDIEIALRECKGISRFELELPSNDPNRLAKFIWTGQTAGKKERLKLEKYNCENEKRISHPFIGCSLDDRLYYNNYLEIFVEKYLEHMKKESKLLFKN